MRQAVLKVDAGIIRAEFFIPTQIQRLRQRETEGATLSEILLAGRDAWIALDMTEDDARREVDRALNETAPGLVDDEEEDLGHWRPSDGLLEMLAAAASACPKCDAKPVAHLESAGVNPPYVLTLYCEVCNPEMILEPGSVTLKRHFWARAKRDDITEALLDAIDGWNMTTKSPE